MTSIQTLEQIIMPVIEGISSQRKKAIALHDFAREKVKFGFNKYFDATPDAYTLSYGYGHCNPKSHLMVSLFQAAGFESFQHFVTLTKEFMLGVIPPAKYWMIPPEVSHSFVEVKVDGEWCSIDSYVVDTPLLTGALEKLTKENREVGYGVRSGSVNVWDGQSNAFSQYRPELSSEDHGQVDDIEAYFNGDQYRNKFLGMPFNKLFMLLGESNSAGINAYTNNLRKL